jgi:hypothetical protein
MSSDTLRQAIALDRAGDKDGARALLQSILDNDPMNVRAWLWMTDVVPTDEEKKYCLEIVLSINPDNKTAQAGMKFLGAKRTEAQFDESALPKHL